MRYANLSHGNADLVSASIIEWNWI